MDPAEHQRSDITDVGARPPKNRGTGHDLEGLFTGPAGIGCGFSPNEQEPLEWQAKLVQGRSVRLVGWCEAHDRARLCGWSTEPWGQQTPLDATAGTQDLDQAGSWPTLVRQLGVERFEPG